MAKFKLIILTLAFLAALVASLSVTDWGPVTEHPLGYAPSEGMRLPESGVGDISSPPMSSPLRFWPWS